MKRVPERTQPEAPQGWLDPLRAALDEASSPVDFFLRDDDAGWGDARLYPFLDVVERHRLALDLAVIPQELRAELAQELTARRSATDGRLALHQHGLAHRSHEPDRKCEFGPSRDRDAQRRDLLEGHERLNALLPGVIQPVFTPPWNRCTRTTGELLSELGFEVLSREASEPPLEVPGLIEVPISVDWSYGRREGRRITFTELGELAAERVRLGGPVGINLHHEVMDQDELALLDELGSLISGHGAARGRPLLELALRRQGKSSTKRSLKTLHGFRFVC